MPPISWLRRKGAPKGQAVFDAWSLAHMGAGILIGLLAWPWIWGVSLILGYEAFEAGLRRIKTEEGGLFEFESWPNIVGDVIVGIAGFAGGRATHLASAGWPF